MPHRFAHPAFVPIALRGFANFFPDDKPKAIRGSAIGAATQNDEWMRPRLAVVPHALEIHAAPQTKSAFHFIFVSIRTAWVKRKVVCARARGARAILCARLWFSFWNESRECVIVSTVWVDKSVSLLLLNRFKNVASIIPAKEAIDKSILFSTAQMPKEKIFFLYALLFFLAHSIERIPRKLQLFVLGNQYLRAIRHSSVSARAERIDTARNQTTITRGGFL